MKEESKSIFGVAYLYIIISSVLRLLSCLNIFADAGSQIADLLLSQIVWFLITVAIIIVLYSLNKKQNQSLLSLLRDNTVRKTTGILILTSGLLSLSVYISPIVSIVSMLNVGGNNSIVAITALSFLIILCEIFIGIYMVIYKDKTNEEYSAKEVLGIAFLYSAANTAFSLAPKLSSLIKSSSGINVYNLLWYIFAAAILAFLYRLNRRQKQGLVTAFQNETVRKSTGALILTGGLISASNLINSVRSIYSLIGSDYGTDNYIHSSIVTESISFVIVFIQIAFGIYLLEKSKPGGGRVLKLVLQLVYLAAFIVLSFVLATKLMGHSVTGDGATEYYSLWFFAVAAICFGFFRLSKKQQ
jgi:hypothetical protein